MVAVDIATHEMGTCMTSLIHNYFTGPFPGYNSTVVQTTHTFHCQLVYASIATRSLVLDIHHTSFTIADRNKEVSPFSESSDDVSLSIFRRTAANVVGFLLYLAVEGQCLLVSWSAYLLANRSSDAVARSNGY